MRLVTSFVCEARASGAAAFALGSLLAATACSEADPRPEPVNDCNQPACVDVRNNGTPQAAPSSSGNDGSDGAAGNGGDPEAGPGTLAGTVRQVASQDMESSQSLQGAVEVRAPNARPNEADVVAPTGSGGTFRLDGIQQGLTTWVGVGAFDDPPSEPFIDTLQEVDSSRANYVDLVVLRRDVIRELAATAFLNGVVELDPLGAHVVVRFARKDGSVVEGVRIDHPPPGTVNVAFDSGDTYSDALDRTADRGMAVLLNLTAAPFPGGVMSIVADVDGRPLRTQLPIAQSAVTVVTAIVPDP